MSAISEKKNVDMLCEAMQTVTPREHKHCWHDYRGAIWMVIPDGHIVQKCCKCPKTRVIHAEHRSTA